MTHSHTCAIFTGSHGQPISPGTPAPWQPVPCDCHLSV